MLFVSTESFSQITFEFQNSFQYFFPVKLTTIETKYFNSDQWSMNQQNVFSLYNLDGTLYKTIIMAPKPDTTYWFYGIHYISRTLFDNDPSNIEYMVNYNHDSSNYPKLECKIIREDGTILLDEIDAALYGIFNTEEGPKLILDYTYANGWYYQTKVFSLPGQIPTLIGDKQNIENARPFIYPNPNNGSFFVKFNKNEGNGYMIDLYTTNGKLIDTYKSLGNPTQISTIGLSEGTYLINTRNKDLNSSTKMILKR